MVPMIELKGRQKKPLSRFFPDQHSIATLFILLLVWYFLAGDNPKSWFLGLPAIVVALGFLKILPPAVFFLPSFTGLLFFIPFFLLQSVLSGFDVLRRVFAPRLPIAPGLITYESVLPAGAPLLLFVNTISLLPGTLSVDFSRTCITVHTLDRHADVEADLEHLETRIVHLFRVPPSPSEGDEG